MPLIEKKLPISEIARKAAEEISPVEVPAKSVGELAALVEAARPLERMELPFPDRYYKWPVIGAICLIIIAIAALFYISQWLR